MKKVNLFLSFVLLVFFTSCVTTGQFETAHTLPAKDYSFSCIGSMGVQTELDVPNYFDSTKYGSIKLAFNKGINDKIELGIESDIVFVTTLKLKFRLTELDKPFAMAFGPTVSVIPFSVFLSDSKLGGPYSPVLNGGFSLYSSYKWSKWIVFANTHGLIYTRTSIFYKDITRSTNIGFGLNGGIIRQLVENKMSVGLQFSVEKLDTFLESSISMGVIYRFSPKPKKP